MESLKFTSLIPCKSSVNLVRPRLVNHHDVIGQVGFAPLWKKQSKREALRLRASVSGKAAGSQDGASVVEDEKEEAAKAVLFGAERDSSGSVIGFNLCPPNGKSLLNFSLGRFSVSQFSILILVMNFAI